MALTRVDGTITLTDTNETNLFAAQTDLKHYATAVYLNNMVDTPTLSIVTIRVYGFDNNAVAERLWDFQEIKGAQQAPLFYVPMIQVEGGYRVSAQRSSSSNITITFDRFEAL